MVPERLVYAGSDFRRTPSLRSVYWQILPQSGAFNHSFTSYSVFSLPKTCFEFAVRLSRVLSPPAFERQRNRRACEPEAECALLDGRWECGALSILAECYYDAFANKKVHFTLSGCYNDQLRKAIVTMTSKSSLYLFYLRVLLCFFD